MRHSQHAAFLAPAKRAALPPWLTPLILTGMKAVTVSVTANKFLRTNVAYTKFENRKSRHARDCREMEQLTLGTHRLSPDLRTRDATNTDECVTVPGQIYIRMSDPHACPVIVCAEGCSMNVQECLCRRARYTVCSMVPGLQTHADTQPQQHTSGSVQVTVHK